MIARKKILVVDDEVNILQGLQCNLELEGYETITADNGKSGIALLDEQHFDLVILDIQLPDYDGYSICKQFRAKDSETPLIFISALHASSDRVHGLKLGADDFLTKPFDLEELLLKVNRLVNRSAPKPQVIRTESNFFHFGQCSIDMVRMEASGPRDKKVELSKMEFELIKYFIKNMDKPVTREELLQNVWGYLVAPDSRTVDNFVMYLRKYFEVNPDKPKHFVSIRGVGYKFVA